jgi:hypothetical protein
MPHGRPGPQGKIESVPGLDNLVFRVGDCDGDGLSDLVARTPNGTPMLCSGNGSEGSSRPRRIATGWNAFSCVFSSRTSNGDGKSDIIATMLQWAVVPLPRQRIGWILATSTHRSGLEGVLHHHQLWGL